MELGIKGKIALITGAGRGIGEAIAYSLAKENVTLIVVSKTKKDLTSLINKTSNPKLHYIFPADLSKESESKKLIYFIKKKKIIPDIIVNNVGGTLNINNPLAGVSDWRKVLRINLEVGIEINNAFIPYMQKKKWGRICHISSIAGLENQGPPSYCASKAALNAYVRSVGRYLSSQNIVMSSVLPGAILTKNGYWDSQFKMYPAKVKKYLEERMAIKRFGTVEEISEFVVFLCSKHSSFCSGSQFLLDGGQGRLF